LQRSADKRQLAEEILRRLGVDATEEQVTVKKQKRQSRDLCI